MLSSTSSRQNSVRGLIVALVAIGLAAPALAVPYSISFQEGVTPFPAYDVEDAELRSSAPDASFEQNPRWNIGSFGPVEREVAGFPISLPQGAWTVTSVSLDVWQNGDSFGAHKTLNLHKITNPNFDFEGENTLVPPFYTDGVTWNSANEADGELWTTPGGDFDPTVLASITPTTNLAGTMYTWTSSPAFIAAVNSALAGDGLLRLIVVATDEVTFGAESFRGSDQGGNPPTQHPRLNIEFVPEPGSAGVVALGCFAAAMRRRPRR